MQFATNCSSRYFFNDLITFQFFEGYVICDTYNCLTTDKVTSCNICDVTTVPTKFDIL